MRESVRFLLAYVTHCSDGLLHTFPSNAHETQWDVHDPTTDISAMHVLFPAVIDAATLLKTDGQLAAQLRTEMAVRPQLPLVSFSSTSVLAATGSPDTIIADSYDPGPHPQQRERWSRDVVCFERFQERSGDDYRALDARLSTSTVLERKIGAFKER